MVLSRLSYVRRCPIQVSCIFCNVSHRHGFGSSFLLNTYSFFTFSTRKSLALAGNTEIHMPLLFFFPVRQMSMSHYHIIGHSTQRSSRGVSWNLHLNVVGCWEVPFLVKGNAGSIGAANDFCLGFSIRCVLIPLIYIFLHLFIYCIFSD